MKLCDLLDCSFNVEVKGIAEDSRLVSDGYIFFATKGYNVDHFDYIEEAIKNGAIAVVCDREPNIDCFYILVDDVRRSLIEVCEKFFKVKTEEFKFIGITGTDGKTTTATIISKLLDVAYIGTNGLCYKNINKAIFNTTPNICELYECLSMLKDANCKTVVMEVSSEALIHSRVDHINYDVICYTNITEDHLNIHKNISNYVAAKRKLLNLVKCDGVVFVNGDDKYCCQIKKKNLYSYGFDSKNNYVIKNVKKMSKNVIFDVYYDGHVYSINSPYIENFNIYNVCLSFIVCLQFGCSSNYLLKKIKLLGPVKGRCEKIDFGQNYEIVLDYAHTYNAIKNIVFEYSDKKIIAVTGAAGGREKEKRKKIGEFLLQNCELVIFTMDDPRFEDVNDIIDQMIGKYTNYNNYLRIIDRKEAIYKAFDMAKEGNVVLILGKGRDNYMAVEDKKINYCDYDVICGYFV